MSDSTSVVSFTRRQCVVMLCVPLAYMVLVAAVAWCHVPAFGQFLAGLGAELPLPTQLLFATFRFWGLVPVAFALAIVDFARRERPTAGHAVGLFVAGCLVGLAMAAFASEGAAAPFFQILDKIG